MTTETTSSETPNFKTPNSETANTETANAEVRPPEATKPGSTKSDPKNLPEPGFGWTAYAEQINGRFAMLGFWGLILLEIFTQQDIWTWLGLR
jgi:hypothetical protein